MTRPKASGNRIPTWLLLGEKPGDNNQMLALAEALGYPYRKKNLRYRHTELFSNLLQMPTLLGVDARNSDPLRPPWPDLLISAGRRSEPVAHWIKNRARGGTRLVHLGRPWRHPDRYDLVISTPQYRLPEGGNILVNQLPLHRIDKRALASAAIAWQSGSSLPPGPYTLLLLGGNSGAYQYDREAGRVLAQQAEKRNRVIAGSLLITSSRRTPEEFLQGIIQNLSSPYHLHRWKKHDPENPYLAFLGLAEQIIVTGESISMVTEAIATGRAVYLFDPRCTPPRNWLNPANLRWQVLSHRLVQHLAPKRLRRDIVPLLEKLVQDNQAAWLADSTSPTPRAMAGNDLQRSVLAVRKLFAG